MAGAYGIRALFDDLPGFLMAILAGAISFMLFTIIAYETLVFINNTSWNNSYYLLGLFVLILEGMVLFVLPSILMSFIADHFIKSEEEAVAFGAFATGIAGVLCASLSFVVALTL